MFTDPLKVTFGAEEISLPRVASTKEGATYATQDGDWEVDISHKPLDASSTYHSITLRYVQPDATPSDPFDPYRRVPNGVTLGFEIDNTRYKSEELLPEILESLSSLVDATFMLRLLGGES